MSTTKAQLRRKYLAARAAESADERTAIASQIQQHLLQQEIFKAAERIFVYLSTEQEIATDALISAAWQADKQVYVPRCKPKGEMQALRLLPDTPLTENHFGILEPPFDAKSILADRLDLVLAPCLACDKRGYRLGYGGGYYDRFLMQTNAQIAVLCASARLADCLPNEPHDIACHYIITEGGLLLAKPETAAV